MRTPTNIVTMESLTNGANTSYWYCIRFWFFTYMSMADEMNKSKGVVASERRAVARRLKAFIRFPALRGTSSRIV